LVHVSQLSDRFVKDPNEVVKVGDKLSVRVLEVDLVRKRIARIATRAGARTGLWSSELDRLFVAWPSRNGQPAEIQILSAPGP